MIFQRDEKGLLHQVDVTLEQLAAEGKQVNLLVAQHMYIMFTDKEQEVYNNQLKIARDNLLADKAKAEESQKAKEKLFADRIAKNAQIDKARQQAEAAKDTALALALEQLSELKKKVEEISSTS